MVTPQRIVQRYRYGIHHVANPANNPFYVNGEYSNTGVDSTPVNEGDTYEFKVEK